MRSDVCDSSLNLLDLDDTELLAPPSDVISAVKFANDGSNRLLASSWDCHIYLYDLQEPGGQCIFKYQHRGPVLDTCFGANSSEAFTACLDHGVRRYGGGVVGR